MGALRALEARCYHGVGAGQEVPGLGSDGRGGSHSIGEGGVEGTGDSPQTLGLIVHYILCKLPRLRIRSVAF